LLWFLAGEFAALSVSPLWLFWIAAWIQLRVYLLSFFRPSELLILRFFLSHFRGKIFKSEAAKNIFLCNVVSLAGWRERSEISDGIAFPPARFRVVTLPENCVADCTSNFL
jgi:hypothetical protein